MLKKIVRITWVDSCVVANWTSFEDIKLMRPPTVVSVGLLLSKKGTFVELVGMCEEGSGNAIQIIPKGCILKIEEV